MLASIDFIHGSINVSLATDVMVGVMSSAFETRRLTFDIWFCFSDRL